MGQYDCTITPQYTNGVVTGYCVDCPEMPEVDAVPARTVVDKRFGWNASAYSRDTHDGDCFVQFTTPVVTGVVVGLAAARRSDHPRDVPYGFYVYSEAGRMYWRVVEASAPKTAALPFDPTNDVMRIERRGNTVRYFFNRKQVYTSTLASFGPLIVVACLYCADDGVN